MPIGPQGMSIDDGCSLESDVLLLGVSEVRITDCSVIVDLKSVFSPDFQTFSDLSPKTYKSGLKSDLLDLRPDLSYFQKPGLGLGL